MKSNHKLINKRSPKQNNKHKKRDKWLKKQEDKLKSIEEVEINNKMSN